MFQLLAELVDKARGWKSCARVWRGREHVVVTGLVSGVSAGASEGRQSGGDLGLFARDEAFDFVRAQLLGGCWRWVFQCVEGVGKPRGRGIQMVAEVVDDGVAESSHGGGSVSEEMVVGYVSPCHEASRVLTSRLRLTPSSAASRASARCVWGGTRTRNLPL